MQELKKQIIKWNENTFPDNTCMIQVKKFWEEVKEFKDSKSIEELADCYISGFGIARFNEELSFNLISHNLIKYTNIDMVEAIKSKMEINKKRNWKMKNGVQKHLTL